VPASLLSLSAWLSLRCSKALLSALRSLKGLAALPT
jgi:hypothetical protein